MKNFIKHSWVAIVLWVLIVALAAITMPDLANLVREKGQAKIGDNYLYSIGKDIQKQMDANGSNVNKELEIGLLYRDPNKISEADKQKIEEKLLILENHKEKYHLLAIKNAIENTDLSSVLYSKDGTTLLVPVYIDKDGRTIEDIRSDFNQILPVEGLQFYSTGSDFVIEDFIQTTEAGVARTEVITIAFIFLILLIIFMSPVTPVVVLATVGLSFFVSLNIVLQLVTHFNFPLSNFTKVFLILILFGIGTDYSLLLLMRFREELAVTNDKIQAIINSYKTAGKTILLSSTTIFIGFASLFFVNFETYRSAAAVAVGVLILILVLFTFIPGLMYLFGKTLFWSPFKSKGHTESKTWKAVSTFSIKYPGVACLVILLLCGLIFFYNQNLSFNNLKEVDPSYQSIIGNNVASKEFGVGLTMPLTITIENPERMDTQEYLADIDKLTNIIKSIDGVKEVHSVTQPKGEVFKELYLQDQSKTLNSGLDSAMSGLDKIDSGLSEAIDKINNSNYSDSSISDLKNGTASLVSALAKLTNGGENELSGITQTKSGSSNLSSGISSLDSNLASLQSSLSGLQTYYSQLAGGYSSIDANLKNLNSSLGGLKTGIDGVVMMETALGSYPTDLNNNGTIEPGEVLGADTTYQTMLGTTQTIDANFGSVISGAGSLESSLAGANSQMASVNAGLSQAQAGLSKIQAGVDELYSGSQDLQSGLYKVETGQQQLVSAMSSIESGAKNLQTGQNQLIDGVSSLKSKMNELENGLKDANKGVNDISNGLVDASSYLQGLENSGISQSTFYIPKDEINGDLFPRSMRIFFSPDRKITEWIVILKVDPYSREGLNVAKVVDQVFAAAVQNTSLKNAKWGISGVAQMNVDLQTMSNDAFNFARIVMIAAIFVVMLIITRDFWMTLFVAISLIASYFISISLSGIFFNHIVGVNQLSWNVPFFSFIMIISLGVDYSIFLIMRQKENPELSSTQALIQAAARVGGVIFSAGLILSGTFAAMYPSGVLTLMEIAVTVIIGIMLLCLAFIPFFIPAMISLKSKVFKG